MKHENYDLAQMQSLSLESKIIMSQQRIKVWYEYYDGEVYIAVSGGKDSQVLAHIVKKIYPDVPCVFVNTGLEYTSVVEKGNELGDVVLRPEMSFASVIKKYGYPLISKEIALYISQMQRPQTKENEKTRNLRMNGIRSDGVKVKVGKIPEKWKFLINAPFKISHECCNVMKKRPMHKYDKTGKKPYIGTLADESRIRMIQWRKYGCNAFEKNRPTSQPLSFWTENDILEYAKLNNLKLASVYGDIVGDSELSLTGVTRTGCTFCMFGIQKDKDRFLKLKEIEPKKYDFIMNGGEFNEAGIWIPNNKGLGYKFVIDWLNKYGNMGIRY